MTLFGERTFVQAFFSEVREEEESLKCVCVCVRELPVFSSLNHLRDTVFQTGIANGWCCREYIKAK